MKLAFAIFAASMTLTACKDTEVAQQNPSGYYPGHRPSEAEKQAYQSQLPTAQSLAADEVIAKLIVGTWTETEDSDSANHLTLIIKADGSYTFGTKQGNLLSQGTWAVAGGDLLFRYKNTTPPASDEFHKIDRIDSHSLVCGIGISAAGRLRFTREEPPLLVYVGGQFVKPGIYSWTNGMTLQDAFSAAGRFTEFAGNGIRLEHWDGSMERISRSAVHPLTNNPVLRPGDRLWSVSIYF